VPRVSPADRVQFVLEAVTQLQRLQREMDRLAPRDGHYESNRSALQGSIRELRKMISANSQ
jgi:hypothetical protein